MLSPLLLLARIIHVINSPEDLFPLYEVRWYSIYQRFLCIVSGELRIMFGRTSRDKSKCQASSVKYI